MSLLHGERFLRTVPLLAGSIVIVFALVMFAFLGSPLIPVEERGFETDDLVWVAAATLSAFTGALIVVHQHRNLVGWSLMGYGLISATGYLTYGIAIFAAEQGRTSVAAVLEGVGTGLIGAALLAIPAALLFFPTGKLPSRRWLPLAWTMVVASAIGFLGGVVNGGLGGELEDRVLGPGPLEDSLGELATALSGPFFLLLGLSIVCAVLSLILRYRRSIGEERLQLKWVVAAALFLGLILITVFLLAGPGSVSGTWIAMFLALGLMSVPASMGVAVLKYRLYDIDLVISRSLTYGILAIFIGAVYIGIVVGIGELAGQDDSANLGLSILATAIVAFAFQPVRRRVERWANRLVYGERATPYEVLSRFSQRAAEMSDEDLIGRIPRLIVDGTHASAAALWVKSGNGFRIAASWPESDADRTFEATEAFEDPDAQYSLPVLHDDELLGGISLMTERGETIIPAEQELLESLTNGMGLALRNTQLTAELKRQVKDLQRSRDRVVSAADDARRSLEHDLDSGPQQQLVAVKVKLGPTRMLAERAGAVKTAKILADVEEQTGEAITAIREFAAGIYPPLLGAEGLGVALAQQAQKAALPITLSTESIGRYPRDVESAVYFTVLEALQNTAKYAEASGADVRLNEENGDLRFEIHDNGKGFDANQVSKGVGLDGISDRMDTVGGTWRIESTPGSGTVVKGRVPVRDPVRA